MSGDIKSLVELEKATSLPKNDDGVSNQPM